MNRPAMGLLARLARAGARSTGKALSRHVLPDSLIPSWKTQKAVQSGYSRLKKAAKKTANKAGRKLGKKPLTIGGFTLPSARRPAPKKPKQKFDKNGWGMGRNLPSVAFYDEPRPSRSGSSSASSKNKPGYGFTRKVKDLARNPRLVAQMKLDELKHDYQTLKRRYLSDLEKTAKRPF